MNPDAMGILSIGILVSRRSQGCVGKRRGRRAGCMRSNLYLKAAAAKLPKPTPPSRVLSACVPLPASSPQQPLSSPLQFASTPSTTSAYNRATTSSTIRMGSPPAADGDIVGTVGEDVGQ
ncbi:unnamed protein product [Somion occarium]|uniref:Uncharacterized protein n=1 Tax=Somion occarium TaxID=3059160 RepID=A0ABP1CEQ3_9APHY